MEEEQLEVGDTPCHHFSEIVLANWYRFREIVIAHCLHLTETVVTHSTEMVVAGMGNFTISYDLFCILLVSKLIGRIYYHHPDSDPNPGILPPDVSAAVNGVALCGNLAGQLFSSWFRDKLGTKKVHGITIVVICSIASGFSFGNSAKSVMASLCFFRFWQGFGFGIGGDYPLSATIMSCKTTRRTFIAAVCAMQGFGTLASGAVGCVVSAVFNHLYPAPAGSVVPEADFVWRIMLTLVAIPAAMTLYWRMKMPETARDAAAADMSMVLQVQLQEDPENEFGLFSKQFLKRHGLHLLGTASTWFLLDMAYYSQNLFQKDVFTAIGWIPHSKTMNAIEEVFHISRAQTLIAMCSVRIILVIHFLI